MINRFKTIIRLSIVLLVLILSVSIVSAIIAEGEKCLGGCACVDQNYCMYWNGVSCVNMRVTQFKCQGVQCIDEGGFAGGKTAPASCGELIPENTAPTTVLVNLTPEAPLSLEDLTCTVNATDPDEDTLTYEIIWEKNGAPFGTDQQKSVTQSTEQTFTLLARFTQEGDTWQCFFTATDPDGLPSSQGESLIITILDYDTSAEICKTEPTYVWTTSVCCGDDKIQDTGTLVVNQICLKDAVDETIPWSWLEAGTSKGDVYKVQNGNFDVVSDGSIWHACNIASTSFTGSIKQETDIVSTTKDAPSDPTTNSFFCYLNDSVDPPIQQFAVCAEPSSINGGNSGQEFTIGDKLSNKGHSVQIITYPETEFEVDINGTKDQERLEEDLDSDLEDPNVTKTTKSISDCVCAGVNDPQSCTYQRGLEQDLSCPEGYWAYDAESDIGLVTRINLTTFHVSGYWHEKSKWYESDITTCRSIGFTFTVSCISTQRTKTLSGTISRDTPMELGTLEYHKFKQATISPDKDSVKTSFDPEPTIRTTSDIPTDMIKVWTIYSVPQQVATTSYDYWCTEKGTWTDDLDTSTQATCTAVGYEWTGDYCCGEWKPRYFNDPSPWKPDTPSGEEGGCWYTHTTKTNTRVYDSSLNKNPGFEQGGTRSGYADEWPQVSEFQPANTRDVVQDGERTVFRLLNSDTNKILSQWSDFIRVDPTKEYELSATVRGESTGITIWLMWYNENKTGVGIVHLVLDQDISEYTTFTQTASVPAADQDKVKFARIFINNQEPYEALFDQVSLRAPYPNVMNYEGVYFGCNTAGTAVATIPDNQSPNNLVTNQAFCDSQGTHFCSPNGDIWEYDDNAKQRDTVKTTIQLVRNPSFEQDSDGDGIPDNVDIQRYPEGFKISTESVTGTNSLIVEDLVGDPNEGPYYLSEDFIPVDTNLEYTLSGWSKSTDGGQVAYIGLQYYTSDYTKIIYNYPALAGGNPPTTWTKYFGTVSFPADTAFVKLRIFGTYDLVGGISTLGSIWFDDIQLLIGDSVDIPLWNGGSVTPFSCCPQSNCWNGTICVGSTGPNGDIDTNPSIIEGVDESHRWVCIEGTWQSMVARPTWDYGDKGFCVDNTHCLVNPDGNFTNNGYPENYSGKGDFYDAGDLTTTPQCINNTQYLGDHYCDNGEWTSRTKYIALQLLDLMETTNNDNYSLFCDFYDNTLNDYSYQNVLSTLQGPKPPPGLPSLYYERTDLKTTCTPGTNFPCTNNFCVLEYENSDGGRTVAFGTSLNHPVNSDFITILDTDFTKKYCDTVTDPEHFAICNNDNRIWYNKKYNAVIYSKQGISLTNPNWQGIFSTSLRTPHLNILNTLSSTINLNWLTKANDYKKLYIANLGEKTIKGFVETMQVEGTRKTLMVLDYSGFDVDICNSINVFNQNKLPTPQDILYHPVGDNCSMKKTYASQNWHLKANPFWINLTAPIRLHTT